MDCGRALLAPVVPGEYAGSTVSYALVHYWWGYLCFRHQPDQPAAVNKPICARSTHICDNLYWGSDQFDLDEGKQG